MESDTKCELKVNYQKNTLTQISNNQLIINKMYFFYNF